jgi:O-antigen ligase
MVLVTGVDSSRLLPAGLDRGRWLVLFPFWLVPLALLVRSRSLPRALTRSPLCWLAAWATWTTITAAWSLRPVTGMLIALPMATMVAYPAWYVSQFGFPRFLACFTASSTTFVVVGLLADAVRGPDPGAAGRWSGLSFSPTGLGVAAALCSVSGAALWASGRHRPLAATGFAAGALALALSQSRSSTISVIVALAVASLVTVGPWRTLLRFGTVALLLVTILRLAGDGTSSLSRSGDSRELTTLTGRTEVWSITSHLIADRPVAGHGVGSSGALFAEVVRSGQLWWEAFSPHNVLLTVALETGAIGLVLFATALVAVAVAVRTDAWALALVATVVVNGQTEGLVERPSLIIALLSAVAATALGARAGAGGLRGTGATSVPGRLAGQPVGWADLRPLRQVWADVSRRAAPVLLAVGAVGLVAALLSVRAETRPAARARVALAEAGPGPSYRAAADRMQVALASGPVREAVLGGERGRDATVGLALPTGEPFVDVVATAPSRRQAEEIAAAAAGALVDAEDRRSRSVPTAQLAAVQQAIGQLDASAAEAQRRLDVSLADDRRRLAMLPAADPLSAEVIDAQRLIGETERAGLAISLEATLDRRIGLATQASELESTLAHTTSDVALEGGPWSIGRPRQRVAVAGGLAAAVLAGVLAGATVLVRRRSAPRA